MRKKKRVQNTLSQVRKDLDYYVANLKEVCERCGQPLVVHGFRRKTLQRRQAVYAHCINNGENPAGDGVGRGRCPKYNQEICFFQQL
jgi:hypothetical protein